MPRRTLAHLREKVSDVIPRMPVEPSPETLLVQEVSNQADTPTQHEETVEHTHLEVVLGLLGAEGAAVAEQVDEADGNATVDVEDKVVLLGGCDRLDGDGVVEEGGAGEVCLAEFLHERNAKIGVVAGLYAVTDTGNWKVKD